MFPLLTLGCSEDRIPTSTTYPRPRAPTFVPRSQVGRAAYCAGNHSICISRRRGAQVPTEGFCGSSCFERPVIPRTEAKPTCTSHPVVQRLNGAFVFGTAASCCKFGCEAARARTFTAGDAAEGAKSEEEEREGGGKCRGRWGLVSSSGVYFFAIGCRVVMC